MPALFDSATPNLGFVGAPIIKRYVCKVLVRVVIRVVTKIEQITSIRWATQLSFWGGLRPATLIRKGWDCQIRGFP
jgi:hypothetical protein